MTDLSSALADVSGLQPFEGKAVLRSTIAITNAGDGLSNAMKVEPVEFHQGETVYVVLECEVASVGFKPIDKDDPGGPQARVHTFRAGTATIVDGAIVKEQVAEQAERIRIAKEQAQGIQRLPLGDDEPTGDEATDDKPKHETEDTDDGELRAVLTKLSKANLRALCDGRDLTYTTKATGAMLVDMLVNADDGKLLGDALLLAPPPAPDADVIPIGGRK